jgi:hypothetical protein
VNIRGKPLTAETPSTPRQRRGSRLGHYAGLFCGAQSLAIPLKIGEYSRRFSLKSQRLRLQRLSLVGQFLPDTQLKQGAQSIPQIENVFRN